LNNFLYQLNQKKIHGIIISAGLSSRMGKFKPLLNYKGKSFVHNIVLKLNSVCDKIIIVTGFKANEVEENVNQLNTHSKIEFVRNKSFEKGMFTSLQAGLVKAKESDWIIYHFVDQPGLPEVFYKKFVEQIDDKHNWIQPKIREQKGHPILIHKGLIEHILSASGDSNLREISADPIAKKKFWECGYKEIFQDIDTEEDYSDLN
jgi:molybdenum cofactor cytidylyltransferase